MKGKIGLEEHFAIPETLECSERYFEKEVWPEFSSRILDLMENRIAEMDRNGMDIMILSLNSPAIQAIYDREQAIKIARKANDVMAEAIKKNPTRLEDLPLYQCKM